MIQKSYYYKNKPDFSYVKLRTETKMLTENIRKLKMQLQKTNLETMVQYKDDKISLAELIIRIGDIRAEISMLNGLYKARDEYSMFRYDEDNSVQPQVPPKDIEKEIAELNKEKTKLDGLLQHTNWTIDLI